MAQINYGDRTISCKIVYYGPGLSGKTTNLQKIYEMSPEQNKGKMVSLATEGDRTLYFDFLPLDLGEIKGFKTKFQLYTVPGQVYYNATRKLVLKGVDAVIFVADSSPKKMQENKESLQNLIDNLKEMNIELVKDVPFVIQYNKRDLPDALPVEVLRKELNIFNVPDFEAVAVQGIGIFKTLKAVAKLFILSFHENFGFDVEIKDDNEEDEMIPASSSATTESIEKPNENEEKKEVSNEITPSSTIEDLENDVSNENSEIEITLDDVAGNSTSLDSDDNISITDDSTDDLVLDGEIDLELNSDSDEGLEIIEEENSKEEIEITNHKNEPQEDLEDLELETLELESHMHTPSNGTKGDNDLSSNEEDLELDLEADLELEGSSSESDEKVELTSQKQQIQNNNNKQKVTVEASVNNTSNQENSSPNIENDDKKKELEEKLTSFNKKKSNVMKTKSGTITFVPKQKKKSFLSSLKSLFGKGD